MLEFKISDQPERCMPIFSWEELQEQLEAIAATPVQRSVVATLVSGVRKQSPFLPPAQVLKEILCLAWVIADEEFQPGSEAGPD